MKFMKVPQEVTSAFCCLVFSKGIVVKLILIQMALWRQKASTIFVYLNPNKNEIEQNLVREEERVPYIGGSKGVP